MKTRVPAISQSHPNCIAFTLIEAMFVVATLAMIGGAIATLYMTGIRAVDSQADGMLVQSRLRSEMEEMIAKPFDQLSGSSSSNVVIKGKSYTLTRTVSPIDLDGDSTPEPTAREVRVALEGQTLMTIIVDHEGGMGKL